MNVDLEANYRSLDSIEGIDESDTILRLDRLSYWQGGTRFSPNRWELGRFLQHGFPEFGILDGFEWGRRRANGDRFGVSVGFMPEPNKTLDTGQDFQVAAYYDWVASEEEKLTFGGGFQQTFHDGDSDRSLFVGRVRWVPDGHWDVQSSAWVDLYTSGDLAKGAGVELTQAWVLARRHWDRGDGVEFSFRHLRYPELDRQEFTPVTLQQLADDRYDRLAVRGWNWFGDRSRWYGLGAVWNDEQESGGDGELGLEFIDLLARRSRVDLSAFGTLGQFSSVLGGRVAFDKFTNDGQWSLLYEISDQRQDGFTEDFDDIVQHRVRGSRDFRFGPAWRLSVYAEGYYWNEDPAASAGFFLQRSF
jgi:hypothetical protein